MQHNSTSSATHDFFPKKKQYLVILIGQTKVKNQNLFSFSYHFQLFILAWDGGGGNKKLFLFGSLTQVFHSRR